MPELPEVETTCRAISPLLLGEELVGVEAFVPKLRYPIPDVTDLGRQTVTSLTRRAKYILMELSGGLTLVIHLGMSGRLTTKRPEKHGHLVIRTKRHEVYLHDPRRFGLVLLMPTKDVEKHSLFASLGPEPLTETFTGKVLKAALANSKMPIKPVIMNPKVVVGVGNIYASESLFAAKISPKKPAQDLTLAECNRLVASIKAVLARAIESGGSSLRDFAHPDGQLGNFQNTFYVYNRAGLPCLVCGEPIFHTVQAQRSTYYCAHCQR